MARERKSFAFKLDAPPDDEGHFTGSAAVFGNVDRGKDVIEPGAATKTIQENPEVPIFWVHNYTLVPIGVGSLSLDGKKSVQIDGSLFLETSELAREVFGAMKAGVVKGLSIGYETIKRRFEGGIRHLQEIAIGEVSLATTFLIMNPLAEVTSVKTQKWLGQYGSTESVDCVLSLIGTATDYLASEVAEGDSEDVARIQSILPILAECLASEIADVADSETEDADVGVDVYVEMMTAPVELAVKKLQALLEHAEPAGATRRVKRAAIEGATEPDMSTLAAFADLKSALTIN